MIRRQFSHQRVISALGSLRSQDTLRMMRANIKPVILQGFESKICWMNIYRLGFCKTILVEPFMLQEVFCTDSFARIDLKSFPY